MVDGINSKLIGIDSNLSSSKNGGIEKTGGQKSNSIWGPTKNLDSSETEKSLFENKVSQKAGNQVSSKTKDNREDVVSGFKRMDKDGDLKLSANEYVEAFVRDCIENGYGANPGQNLGDIITEKYAEFKRYAGEDVSMNIDEFRNMLEGHLVGSNIEGQKENLPSKQNIESSSLGVAIHFGNNHIAPNNND